MIIRPADLDQTKLGQMGVRELGIKQRIALRPEACCQKDQRHLAGVGHARKHTLAKKGPVQRQPINPAQQLAWLLCVGPRPDLDAVCMALAV